ncbi:acetyl-CoA carboxylase biotin carboxyl carrier protein [Methyloferula stellata]|uniref:acetyl-CoA carboxylase biotin carboxyl carrier protein n=1 Tax=Methyloferula stellata TaxID=876270 RepID=UPI000363B941|nr:acetyl-CoA carboxylase biotin carboxyl carrier protein [Methyloferula stellata]
MKERPDTDKGQAPGAVDTRLVEKLGEIATRLNLSEIEIQNGDFAIRVARNFGPPVAVQPAVQQPAAAAAEPAASAPKPESAGTVKSPMVGTAYRRASPQAAPFVELGTNVKAGDKILLVEAMKTFNEIIAPCAGTVISILVEDGQPVEYGQPLMVIE